MTNRRREGKGFLFCILATLMYTSMATIVKFSSHVNNETLIFFRNLFCLIMVFPMVIRSKESIISPRMPLHLLRGVAGLAAIYAYFYAIRHLELSNAILLATTMPLFTPLVVLVWLKYKVPLRRVVALIIGFIGVVVVLQPGKVHLEFASFMGLLSGLCGATALVSVRQLSKTEPTHRILFYFFVISTVISFFPMVIFYEPIDAISWVYIIGIGVSAVLFQLFITKAFTHAPATKVSGIMYLNVILGGIAGWLFFDQLPSFWLVIGAVLIILGGLLALWDKKDPVKMS